MASGQSQSTAIQLRKQETIETKQDGKLSSEMKQLVRDQWFKNSTDAEFQLAVATCERLQLDPVARQVHFVKIWDSGVRREVMQAVTSIGGLRIIAQRTGEYRGRAKQEWCGDDGQWVDVWLKREPPRAARCGVNRAGFVEPTFAVATYDSYVRTNKTGEPNATWKKMADVMLHKCAEAAALRAAFPQELTGIYSEDELDHTQSGQVEEPKTLEDGKHGFGFRPRQDQQQIIDAQPEHKSDAENYRNLLDRIDKAQNEEDLRQCTVNGTLSDEHRLKAKRHWVNKLSDLRATEPQQEVSSAWAAEEPAPPPSELPGEE